MSFRDVQQSPEVAYAFGSADVWVVIYNGAVGELVYDCRLANWPLPHSPDLGGGGWGRQSAGVKTVQ